MLASYPNYSQNDPPVGKCSSHNIHISTDLRLFLKFPSISLIILIWFQVDRVLTFDKSSLAPCYSSCPIAPICENCLGTWAVISQDAKCTKIFKRLILSFTLGRLLLWNTLCLSICPNVYDFNKHMDVSLGSPLSSHCVFFCMIYSHWCMCWHVACVA